MWLNWDHRCWCGSRGTVFGHKCHTQASKKVKGDALPVASTTADPTLTTSPAPLEPSMQAPQEPQELGLNNIKRNKGMLGKNN